MLKISLLVSAAALLPAAALAQSADSTSWTGPYVGVHGGYGFDTDRQTTNVGTTPNNLLALSAGIRPTRLVPNRSGLLGGGQAGFNFQTGNVVLGAEGDFSFMDSKGTYTYRSPQQVLTFPAGRRAYVKNELNWLGTVRGRVGYALPGGMIYATGGYAYGKIKGRAEFNGDTESVVNYSGRHNFVGQGWTAGGGAELRPFTTGMLARTSVKMDILYYRLGRSRIYALQQNTPPGYYVLGTDTQGVTAKVGLNYAF